MNEKAFTEKNSREINEGLRIENATSKWL